MSSANWWTDYFDAQYLLEYEPLFSPRRDRAEVARLVDVLGLPSGARILDVPCGQGRHAHLLAEAGFDVDGYDYSVSSSSGRANAGLRRGSGIAAATCGCSRQRGRDGSTRFSTRSRRSASSLSRRMTGAYSRNSRECSPPAASSCGTARAGTASWRAFTRDWWQTKDGTLIAQERSYDAPLRDPERRVGVGGKRRSGERRIAFASTRRRGLPSCARTWAHRRARVRQFPRSPTHATLERNDDVAEGRRLGRRKGEVSSVARARRHR